MPTPARTTPHRRRAARTAVAAAAARAPRAAARAAAATAPRSRRPAARAARPAARRSSSSHPEGRAARPVCAPAIVCIGVTTFDQDLLDATGGVTARLHRIVGDRAAAEDLCQETLVRAWRAAPRDLPQERLRAWLHRTATNLAFDELRRRARRGEVGYDDDALAGGSATDAAVAGADVRAALAE